MERIESILNIKSNQKHCTLEYLIKKSDGAQDMSRAGLLKRMAIAAEPVENWMPTYTRLSDLKLEKEAPAFTNWQAKYDKETAIILDKVKNNMQKSLKEGGVITRVVQTQFMVQLLMINYLEHLKKAKLSINANKIVDKEISIPEMSAIFTEMILTDKECESLKDIRKILVAWRNAK